jgi:hypothetical protein
VPLRAKLSTLVVGISNALVDIRMLPTQDILKLPKTVQEIFAATGLILEHLREGHTYGTGPWDQSLAGRRLLGPLAIVPLIFSFDSLVVDVIYILIYIYIGKLVPLHLRFHGSPTVASRGPTSHARQAAPPRWGHPS